MVKPSFETIEVYPLDHEKLPPTTKYDLSDYDLQGSGLHTIPSIVYPFSGNKQQAIENIRLGLQNLITCIPLVGGELLNETGRIWVLRKNHEAVKLNIQHLDEDSTFPSYETLAAEGFPVKIFSGADATRFTPPNSNLTGARRDDGCPVGVFQVNFIQGGVILTLAMAHFCADAKTLHRTFGFWAAGARAAAENAPMPELRISLDRTYFNARKDYDKLSQADVEALKAKIRGFAFNPIDPKSTNNLPPPQPPATKVIYHFSASSREELKKVCWPTESESDVKFVSTYDAVCGLAWRAMTRARLQRLQSTPGFDLTTAQTSYIHAVDGRDRVNAKLLSPLYYGNGFNLMPTDPLLITDLVGEEGLPKAAQAIRRATERFDENTMPDTVTACRAVEGKERMRFVWNAGNIMGSSWTSMKAFDEKDGYDFGFGLPVAIRPPVASWDGVLLVLPADRVGGKSDGYNVYTVLETSGQELLLADPEFRKYCKPVGE